MNWKTEREVLIGLCNRQNMIGDQHKHCIHMNGLRQMVSMRGGMDKLGMNGVLRRLILWYVFVDPLDFYCVAFT